MLKKSIILAIVSLNFAVAQAKNYQTIKEDVSEFRSQQSISYEVLESSSAPAAEVINKAVKENLLLGLCGASEDQEFPEYTYEASAKIIEENSNYIGIEVTHDSYCGGAHPNYGVYHLTYNAKTGQAVDMDVEVPQQKYNDDYVAHEKYQATLAKKMAAHIKKIDPDLKDESFQCLVDARDNNESVAEFIANMYPTLAGLGKNNSLIATISPPHAMTACVFQLEMSLSEVESLLAPKSIIKSWLAAPTAE